VSEKDARRNCTMIFEKRKWNFKYYFL
jgi:hypothetical protein